MSVAIAHTVRIMPSFLQSMRDCREYKAIARHISGIPLSPTRLSRLVATGTPPWRLPNVVRTYIASQIFLEATKKTLVENHEGLNSCTQGEVIDSWVVWASYCMSPSVKHPTYPD